MTTQTLTYFDTPLPWQQQVWQQLTGSFNNDANRLSHALLAAGREGIGKRALIWRWVAWQLCEQKTTDIACGNCQSCQWLSVGNHPDVYVLPECSSPSFAISQEQQAQSSNRKTTKSKKSASKGKATRPNIKIDDIRAMQEFVSHTSQKKRICVFDYADSMTLGASNALLKTLEEPNNNVQLILITDQPSQLLPTINSRVQKIPLGKIDIQKATQYLRDYAAQQTDGTLPALSDTDIDQLLKITGYAALASIRLAKSAWYPLRQLWLTTWLALRSGSRTAVAAADYWSGQLALAEFIELTQLMIDDLRRISVGFAAYQQDIDFSNISDNHLPTDESLSTLLSTVNEINDSLKQNVQEKFAYDMLMAKLANL